MNPYFIRENSHLVPKAGLETHLFSKIVTNKGKKAFTLYFKREKSTIYTYFVNMIALKEKGAVDKNKTKTRPKKLIVKISLFFAPKMESILP